MNFSARWLKPFTKGNVFSRKKHQETLDALNPLLNISVPGGSVTYSDTNVVIKTSKVLSDSPGSGASVSTYRFKSMASNWLVCRSWNFTSDGSTDILIAKAPKLRFSIASETIDGDTVTYSAYDTSAQTRHASDGVTSEDQVVTPRYLVNDVLYVVSGSTGLVDGSANPIALIDLNLDARAWAKIV